MQSTKSSNQRNSVQPENTSQFKKQDKICQICAQNQLYHQSRFFATCIHSNYCVSCYQSHLSHCLSQNIYPKCPQIQCDAQINFGQTSLISLFSIKTRKKLNNFLKTTTQKKQQNNKIPCRVPNCQGIITKSKCMKCSTYYCKYCNQFEHSIKKICTPQDVQLLNIKFISCPKCKRSYQEGGGCLHMKCFNKKCNYEWCRQCNQKWSAKHHACRGTDSLKLAFRGFINQLGKK